MKKVFTFVAALFCLSMGAWAEGTEGTELFDPSKASINSTRFAPNWELDNISTASYNDATLVVQINSNLGAQWQGQVKLNHNVAFDATKAYVLSMKFHTNRAVNKVTLKMDNNAEIVYENQSISLPSGDYTYTSKKSNGVANNDKVLVFDFGYASAGTEIIITEISIKEVGDAVTPDPVTHPSPATAPTMAAADVFSIYSDAYNAGTKMAIGGWSQQTKVEEVNLSDTDKAYYCTNSNYLGFELNSNVAIAALAGYKKLHFDMYVAKDSTVQFSPVWGTAGTAALHTYNLVAGWNAVDIDLTTDFAGIDLAGIYQIKWDKMPKTCYIDNVYFYKDKTTAIDAATTEVRAEKVLRNGQVMILRNGTLYTTQGQEVK